MVVRHQKTKGVLMRYSFKKKDRSLPLFIDSIGYNWTQENITRPVGYPYIHWLHTQSGEGSIIIHDKEYALNTNQGILIRHHIPHTYKASSDNWKTAYFTFGGSLVNEILDSLNIEDFLLLDNIQHDIDKFIRNVSVDISPYFTLDASQSVYSFLMLLKKHQLVPQEDLLGSQSIISTLIKYLEVHYSEQITNEQLANQIGYSTQYTSRLFKQIFKISPYQYLIELRIRKAKELLVNNTNLSIQEIAVQVGFNDTSYFISTFKKIENQTPKQFQKYFK